MHGCDQWLMLCSTCGIKGILILHSNYGTQIARTMHPLNNSTHGIVNKGTHFTNNSLRHSQTSYVMQLVPTCSTSQTINVLTLLNIPAWLLEEPLQVPQIAVDFSLTWPSTGPCITDMRP